jgi:hypothetical protein
MKTKQLKKKHSIGPRYAYEISLRRHEDVLVVDGKHQHAKVADAVPNLVVRVALDVRNANRMNATNE